MRSLGDLDEAVLRCYNKNSAQFLKEAITCYKSGALRSAIVTTWNCIFFDLLEKIRELSLSGDKFSNAYYADFQGAIDRGDTEKLLRIEREILKTARDKLEFFGDIELVDLKRVQEDRNRCAHPTINASGEIFHPSADLARTHIVHAIDHILSFPPTHGKSALDRLLEDVQSIYFPTNVPKALEVLENSPITRARRSFSRNFVVVLLKLLVSDVDYKAASRASAALKAFAKLNHEIFVETVQEEASKIVRGVEDKNLHRVTKLLSLSSLIWQGLKVDQRSRLEGFYQNLSGLDLDYIDSTYNIKELEAAAKQRSRRLSIKDIRDNVWFAVPQIVKDRLIVLLANSESFDEANIVARTIAENISDFSADDIEKIKDCAQHNDQVAHSFEFQKLIKLVSNKDPETPLDL